MQVLVATDKFAGTLTAGQAAGAIAKGWQRTSPGTRFDVAPVADGGPGFVEVLHDSLGGSVHRVPSTGPLGGAVTADLLIVDDTAYVESAQSCGLDLVADCDRDPLRATTFGVGQLVAHALDAGVHRIVVGLGGSATTDGGAGLLAALGAVATDRLGVDRTDELRSGGGLLGGLFAVDLGPVRARVGDVDLVAATDVDVPLLGSRGAARAFGPQKGASAEQVEALEFALTSLTAAIGRDGSGRDPSVALGAGAAGGLGYALLAIGATRVPGTDCVFDAIGLRHRIAAADLVITGEGRFDWQSLRGKTVSGVAALALEHALPCIVLAGDVQVGHREYAASGITAAYSTAGTDYLDPAKLPDPATALATLAERVARTWSQTP